MRRREFITLLGGAMASWPLAVGAQQTAKLPRLGFLTAGAGGPGLPALLEGLRQLGWIEGKTIVIEYRYAENRNDRLPELADALHEAGCVNEELLAHLRGPGPHVRGCWVIDLVLGKE